MKIRSVLLLLLLAGPTLLDMTWHVGVYAQGTGDTTRVSVASDGTQANNSMIGRPSISADGRYVTFGSFATNLAAGTESGDVFVHDRQTRETMLVSMGFGGSEPNGHSLLASISGDGRHVAFSSDATNLIPNDTNNSCDEYGIPRGKGNCPDVFVHDRQAGETSVVSVGQDGTPANGSSNVDGGGLPAMSAEGRYVAFVSYATNLVNGDTQECEARYLGTFNCHDVFVHDHVTGKSTLVSVASHGEQANDRSFDPSISHYGRYVAFRSYADNLVPGDENVFCYDWGEISVVNCPDVFVHDLLTRETIMVSVASDGTQSNQFTTDTAISGDGRYVAFSSDADNLVDRDTNAKSDVFVHDRTTGETSRVSVSSGGSQGNDASFRPSLSFDGRFVSFASVASNLVDNDTNMRIDVFVHDRLSRETTRVSVAFDHSQGDDSSARGSISADGRFVVFWSAASNLVPNDTNESDDIFVHDRGPHDADPRQMWLPLVIARSAREPSPE